MEQHTLKKVSNCLNTNIYSYLEISGVQSSNLYLNVVHFLTQVLIRHLWKLKTLVFLHWCLIHVVLFIWFQPQCFLHQKHLLDKPCPLGCISKILIIKDNFIKLKSICCICSKNSSWMHLCCFAVQQKMKYWANTIKHFTLESDI
jgi:hypothetical protein